MRSQTHKENVCVCVSVCVLLVKMRSHSEHVTLWEGFLGQTSVYTLDKHFNNEYTEIPPTRAQEKMWHKIRWRFCPTESKFHDSVATKIPGNLIFWKVGRSKKSESVNHEKPLMVPEALFDRDSVPLWMDGCMGITGIYLHSFWEHPCMTPHFCCASTYTYLCKLSVYDSEEWAVYY